ncbi:MAG TPA: hypothetical protein VFT22_43710 [Kofleriaceae bacterium]|nr:hypothetical protein [Kofleriaceae bacterium]
MPSSTSSSDHLHVPPRPVPAGPWGRTWIATLVLLVVSLAGVEAFVRARGYRPSVKDNEWAWAWARMRASDGSPHTVALLGTSRIHLAFSQDAFSAALPDWKAVQLAIDGTFPAGSLMDLARDPEFRGIAIVDTLESGLSPDNWYRQDAYIAAYHRRWRAPGAMAERWLATQVQARLAVLSDTGLHTFARGFAAPPYVTTFADRTQFADYGLTDVDQRRRQQLERLGTVVPPTEHDAEVWLADALRLEPYIADLQARGGTVVYLRMPTCDERWTIDQQREPRALFWNRLAAVTRAVAIHFADYPSLRDFACPDTSHIASKDAPRFTRALIEILVDRGVIPRAALAGERASPADHASRREGDRQLGEIAGSDGGGAAAGADRVPGARR